MRLLATSILLFLVSAFPLHAQQYQIGKYDTLHSTILNDDRRILVHVPTAANNNVRYPVMYILDGESHFTKTVGIIDHLSNTAGNELCPQMIIVSIFHPNRERDLIPPSSSNDKAANDNFPDFIEKELIPFVDSHYPTQPYRVFVGHSLGGLRVINTLVYQPKLFNSYIALDPSLGMVKNWITDANIAFNKNNYSGKSLYIAMGLTMPKGMDTAAIIKDTSGNARHMRCIMLFARNAKQQTHNQLDFNWQYYPEETHQSVVFKGTYDGLISNFIWYKNENLFDIFSTDVNADASVKIITEYYEYLSQKMGYPQLAPEQGTAELIDYLNFKKWYDKSLAFAQLNFKNYPTSVNAKMQLETAQWNCRKSISNLVLTKSIDEIYRLCKKEAAKKHTEYNISEGAINTLGYELMQKDKRTDALTIFKLNVELYPNSYNVYDSLGECLLSLGKQEEGIAAYRKSLELNDNNTHAKNVIAKHLGGK